MIYEFLHFSISISDDIDMNLSILDTMVRHWMFQCFSVSAVDAFLKTTKGIATCVDITRSVSIGQYMIFSAQICSESV